LIGAPVGAAIGGLTILKNSRTFSVNDDPEKWKAFRNFLSEKRMELK